MAFKAKAQFLSVSSSLSLSSSHFVATLWLSLALASTNCNSSAWDEKKQRKVFALNFVVCLFVFMCRATAAAAEAGITSKSTHANIIVWCDVMCWHKINPVYVWLSRFSKLNERHRYSHSLSLSLSVYLCTRARDILSCT